MFTIRRLSPFVFFLLCFSAIDSFANEPRIKVTSPKHHFGSVLQGTPVTHSFSFTNTGSGPLQILKITPDCGCSAAEQVPSPVAPGEQRAIDVSFNTTGFFGFKRRTFRVFTNDPTRRSVLLTLEGTVKRDIEVRPSRIYFGPVKQGQSSEQEVLVKVGEDSNAEIIDVLSRSKFLDVEVDNATDSKERTIRVRLRPNTPLGILRSRIILKTSSKKNPLIDVPVFAKLEGELSVEPRTVSFGLLEGPLKESVSREVRLINSGSKSLEVKVSSDSPSVVAQALEVLPNGNHRIRIELPAGTSGSIHSRITIETNHPEKEQRKLSVPVYGIISRKGA